MVQTTQNSQQGIPDGRTLFGPGWKAVDNFDDLSDIDEYESEEEETYVTLDLGAAVEPRSLLTETDYQLIGLDTPIPFLKLNNQIYQGDVASLVGDEVVLGLKRNHENPHNPSHPPLYTTNKRIVFHPVTLKPLHETSDVESTTLSAHATKMRKRILGAPNLRGRTKKSDKRSESGSRKGSVTPAGAVDFPIAIRTDDTGPSAVTGEGGDLPPAVRINNGSTLGPAPAASTPQPALTSESMDVDQPEAGPSQSTPAAPKKKTGRKPKPNQDIVINALEEWYSLDMSRAPQKAKVFLSPGVDLSQIGPGLTEDQRILTQSEVIRIKSGLPLTGKGSRGPRKPKDKDTTEDPTQETGLGAQSADTAVPDDAGAGDPGNVAGAPSTEVAPTGDDAPRSGGEQRMEVDPQQPNQPPPAITGAEPDPSASNLLPPNTQPPGNAGMEVDPTTTEQDESSAPLARGSEPSIDA